MARGKMGLWRMSGTWAGLGGELVQVDMEEMKVAAFESRDVVKPGVVRGMSSRGEGGFKGLEIKDLNINNAVQGGNACMEKVVSVGLNIRRARKVGVEKGREGCGLVEGDKGLKETSVVIGDSTIEVAEEVSLSMV